MDIATLRPSSTTLTAPQIRQAVDTWRVGQVLEASVVSATRGGSVTLKVGELVLTTKGPLPERLLQGTLQLQVQSGGPQPTLKVITPASPPVSAAADALRQALPRQLPLPPLLANLAGFAARPSESLAALPRPVIAALEQLMAAIPDTKQLASAKGVASAFQDSGLFLERKLRGGKTSTIDKRLADDFKAALLRTAAAVRTAASAPAPTPGPAAGKTAMPTAGTGLSVAGAAARNPEAPTSAAQSVASTTPPSLRAGSASVLALPDGASDKDGQESSASSLLPRSGAATSSTTLPPLRGVPLSPQGRAEPSITSGMAPELALRQLAEQLEGAVSRITAAQASQVPSEENPRPMAWTFELPVRHQSQLDVVGVHIERDDAREQQKGAAHGWTVTLSFDFPETGAFHAQLKVLGKVVACRFTAEREQTWQQLQRELNRLDQSLRNAGLEVRELGVRQGTLPRAQQPHFGPLLDLRA